MSDPGSWQAPAGSPWNQPGQPAPLGQPLDPAGAGQGGGPGQWWPPAQGGYYPTPQGNYPQYGAANAWTPPPKPGLIPLRPLGLGDILGGAFQVLRRNPKPTFGLALLIGFASTLIVGGAVGAVTFFMLNRIAMANASDVDTITAGSILAILLATVLSSLVTAAMTAIVQGVISLEVARGALGERNTLRELWRGVRGRFGAIIGWTLLVLVAALLAVSVIAGVVALVFVGAGPIAGAIVAVLLGIVAGLGGMVVSLWLTTKLAFVPVAIVVERRNIVDAVKRSWKLTFGHFWRILGITLLVGVIVSLAMQVVSLPLSFLGPFAAMLIDPNGSSDTALVVLLSITVLSFALMAVATAVALVAQSAVPALLYLDIRMRKEGLDLELQRYVEERAARRQVPENPFLPTG